MKAELAKWTHWDLNPGPSACEADVIPLHHVPDEKVSYITKTHAYSGLHVAMQASAGNFRHRDQRRPIALRSHDRDDSGHPSLFQSALLIETLSFPNSLLKSMRLCRNLCEYYG